MNEHRRSFMKMLGLSPVIAALPLATRPGSKGGMDLTTFVDVITAKNAAAAVPGAPAIIGTERIVILTIVEGDTPGDVRVRERAARTDIEVIVDQRSEVET